MKKIKRHYRRRPYSPIWWMGVVGAIAFAVLFTGLMNSWELGLL